MLRLTLAPDGWTWRHNTDDRRWELGGCFVDPVMYGPNHFRVRSYITDEMIIHTDPEIFVILLKEFASFACEHTRSSRLG